mmetsp:Transcript_38071/g.77471  ORF Transcript_38071/g.77471 Transcript_38071/m.77471 type:complete len:126 (-) Transcript_38071:2528-2905(-)
MAKWRKNENGLRSSGEKAHTGKAMYAKAMKRVMKSGGGVVSVCLYEEGWVLGVMGDQVACCCCVIHSFDWFDSFIFGIQYRGIQSLLRPAMPSRCRVAVSWPPRLCRSTASPATAGRATGSLVVQ